jgi:hypothetical protein
MFSLFKRRIAMARAQKLDLDEATLQIAKSILSTPPKPHKEMKIGKHQAKAGAKVNRPKKTPLQLDGVRIAKKVSSLLLAAYSQIVPRATLTLSSPSLHSRRVSGSDPLDAE